MKKLFWILIFSFFYFGKSHSLDMETCSNYAAKAKTKYAAEIMFGYCLAEEGTHFFNRSVMFKCAKSMLDAKTKYAAELKMFSCLSKE